MLSLSGTAQHWYPWREFDQLRDELSRAFSTVRSPVVQRERELPAINILKREEGGLMLTAELPGLDVENIDVCVTKDDVTIRVDKETSDVTEGESYLRKERRLQKIERTIRLPFEVVPDKTDATYEKGILALTLQQPEQHKPKRLTIKAG